MKKILALFVVLFAFMHTFAQDIPQYQAYNLVYDFIDELAGQGIIEVNSVVKPYSRMYIAEKLTEAAHQTSKLSKRQQDDLKFYLNDYAPECGKLPDSKLVIWETDIHKAAFNQPAFHYVDPKFRAVIRPILGMEITTNTSDKITKRWYGAEIQMMLGKHLSVFGSLRDISVDGDTLASGRFLNDLPGYQYKESTKGGDYSDSRGGITYANEWGSIGLVKDNPVWGDNYHGSNILSGRTPSFPMVKLQLKPAKWFQLDYFHGWLNSNVVDSTDYYEDNIGERKYRDRPKYMAANMMTFTPIAKLNISLGNSIIYAESSVHATYFIPIGFYKSMDHTLTKGAKIENQNSQVYFNISSRNINHLHLYASLFFDEVEMSRFKPSSKERNPVSYKLGFNLTGLPVQDLSLTGEFTRSNILTYKHSIPALTYASNGYNLGSYLGDNSQEIYLSLRYKPIRGLLLNLSYLNAEHGNEYSYIRQGHIVSNVISQPSLGDVIWSNSTFGLKATYELMNNTYAVINVQSSNIKGHDAKQTAIDGETRMTAAQALDYYTPKFLQGNKTVITIGLSFGF